MAHRLLAYGDRLYTSELDFFRAERMPADDNAEPFEIEGELPEFVYRINDADLYFNLDDALRALEACPERLVMWTLSADGRRYEVLATIETATYRALQAGTG